MNEKAARIIQANKMLVARRDLYKPTWDQVSEYVNPHRQETSKGASKTTSIYSSAIIRALNILVAGLYSLLTSPTLPWFKLKMRDAALNDDTETSLWLEDSAERMYNAFAHCQLYNVMAEFYRDIATYSIGGMYVERGMMPRALNVTSLNPYTFTYAENQYGIVDTIYRELKLTARQAAEKFGEDNLCDAIKDVLHSDNERRDSVKFDFLHAVYPRTNRDVSKADNANMPYESVYVDCGNTEIVEESGYHEFPFAVARWDKPTSEDYGLSPAIIALPDVKTVNMRKKHMLIQEEKILNPPLDVPSGYKNRINVNPGGINIRDGNIGDRIQPLNIAGRIDVSAEMLQYDIEQINNAFYVDIFRMFAGVQREMTAYEVSRREAEQMNMFGPVIGRLINECLEPVIVRSFSVMLREGYLLDPPEQIQGQEFEIEYISPLARAMKAAQGNNLQAALSVIVPLVNFYPEMIDNLDGDALFDYVFDLYGCPSKIIKAPKDRDALRQQRQQAVQAEMMKADAERTAAGLKSVAEADKDGFVSNLIAQAGQA